MKKKTTTPNRKKKKSLRERKCDGPRVKPIKKTKKEYRREKLADLQKTVHRKGGKKQPKPSRGESGGGQSSTKWEIRLMLCKKKGKLKNGKKKKKNGPHPQKKKKNQPQTKRPEKSKKNTPPEKKGRETEGEETGWISEKRHKMQKRE